MFPVISDIEYQLARASTRGWPVRWLLSIFACSHFSLLLYLKYVFFILIVRRSRHNCSDWLIDLQVVNFCLTFLGSVWIYLYVYGTFRSFSIRKFGLKKVVMYLFMGLMLIPLKILIEMAAVFWGIMTPKHKFFVVKKDVTQAVWTNHL